MQTIIHAQCCICLLYKMKYIKCKKCKNAVVCRDCIPSLCEEGICDKCPVCRQKEWMKKVKKNKIVPEKRLTVIVQNNERENTCCDNCTCRCTCLFLIKIFRILNLMALIYAAGLLTIAGSNVDLSLLLWLPMLLGLLEFFLIICCCVRCCKIETTLKKICCFIVDEI